MFEDAGRCWDDARFAQLSAQYDAEASRTQADAAGAYPAPSRRWWRLPASTAGQGPKTRNGMPATHDQGELARLALRPRGFCPDPPEVRLYVEQNTTDAEVCSVYLAGF